MNVNKINGSPSLYNIVVEGPGITSYALPNLNYSEDNTIVNLPANGSVLTVIVTDANNPSCTLSFEVEQDPCSECTQVVDAGIGGTITCDNNVIDLMGNGPLGGTYNWIGPNGNIGEGFTAGADFPGRYYFIGTYDDGCMAMDSVFIALDESVPNANGGPDQALTCDITEVVLSADQSTQGQDIIYIWSNANGDIISNEITITVSDIGTYSLTLYNTTSQCSSAVDLVRVTEARDGPSAVIYLDPGNQLNCLVDKIQLSSEEEDHVVYTWTIGSEVYQGAIVDVSQGGNVELIALDTLTGCSNINFETIEDLEAYPIIRIQSAEDLTCENGVVTIDASTSQQGENIIYQWYDNNNSIIENANSNSLSVSSGGFYYLTLTDTSNNCSNTDSIFIDEMLNYPIITAGDDLYFECQETQGTLNASVEGGIAGLEIIWTTQVGNILSGGNTLNPTIDRLGRYYFEVFDPDSGCRSIDSVDVDGSPDGPQIAFLQLDSIICETNTLGALNISEVVGGTPPFTYLLNGIIRNTDGFFDQLNPGNYNLNITDANGCALDTAFTLTEGNSLDISLEAQIILTRGDTTQINAMVNYPEDQLTSIQWTPEDGLSCSDCLDPILTATQAMQYSLFVVNDLGCTAFASFRLILIRDVNVYIPNVFSPNGDGINDFFTVFGDETLVRVNQLMIFDRWGEKVFHNEDFAPNEPDFGWDGTLDGQNMNPAVFVYTFELEFDDGSKERFSGDITIVR
ncbi:MAG: gliding motility-associated C-terminal domain-containing protein [Bacteroidota bacterium]